MRRRWMSYQLKRALISPAVWAVSLIALAVFLLFDSVALSERATAPIGLFSEDGSCARRIDKQLTEDQDSALEWQHYQDEQQMRRDVLTGRLDCAFVLKTSLDDVIFDEKETAGITYLHTGATRKGLVAREKVYGQVMLIKSQAILSDMAHGKKYFKHVDAQLEEKLLATQQQYLDSDKIFRVIFEGGPGNEADQMQTFAADHRKRQISRRLITACLIILAAALMFGRERFTAVYRQAQSAMNSSERRRYLVTRVLGGTALITVCMMIALPFVIAQAGVAFSPGLVLLMLLAPLIMWAVASVLAVGLSALLRREAVYLMASVSVMGLAWVLLMVVQQQIG